MDDDLLAIGRLARLAGLAIGALRHYDDLDLIRPARVDPETGYRFYRRAQLDRARANRPAAPARAAARRRSRPAEPFSGGEVGASSLPSSRPGSAPERASAGL